MLSFMGGKEANSPVHQEWPRVLLGAETLEALISRVQYSNCCDEGTCGGLLDESKHLHEPRTAGLTA